MAPTTEKSNPATRIVGLGASAGGLAPLEQFLAQIPPHSQMAYVVVQHLDPHHKALLPELLQRVTAMPVHEARQGMKVEPDSVYVIAPNTELRVVNGALQLDQPAEPRGLRLPINVLFSSLASALGERAVGVVLSGMGSDGTLGLQAIQTVGGLTAAQQPDTAQFDAMPASAIAAGAVDIVAPPDQLPSRILACVGDIVGAVPAADQPGDEAVGDAESIAVELAPIDVILSLLKKHTRHDFSLYKPSTLQRRVARRMAIHKIATVALYGNFLKENPQEIDLLFREMLIGVTQFFRDPQVWQYLAETALPELLAKRGEQHQLRAWVAGCSTGEEAYSLAIVFAETVARMPEYSHINLQIFASDLSPDAIATARRGRYPAAISSDVSADRLSRFFSPMGNGYCINKDIRDRVLFAQHDVVLDPPFTKLDLLTCRNLLIYFDATLQRKLIPLFHYSLRPEGVLLLGSSETVGRYNHLFSPIQSRLRLYLRDSDGSANGAGAGKLAESFPPLSRMAKELPMSSTQTTNPQSDNLQSAADQVLLQVYAPAAVVINSEGDILYISGRTGKYLEPAAGKANWNIHAMIRDGLQEPVTAALRKAGGQTDPVQLQGLQVLLPGGTLQNVDITVQALHDPLPLRGLLIVVFRDQSLTKAGRVRRKGSVSTDAASTAQLQQYREEIQALREETTSSREELQSANEELQSTNEELQSTNEELTTSKEEMQSMNEELQTINAEMQTKLDDLALAQSDIKNLLNNIEIAILFLDQHLNLRRYTDRAAKIINIRDSDVGRPLSDLTTNLQYPDLHEDARETLRSLVFSEKQIRSDDNRWFTVRIMPYRRLDNVIDGVVITCVDITATKELEATLRQDAKS